MSNKLKDLCDLHSVSGFYYKDMAESIYEQCLKVAGTGAARYSMPIIFTDPEIREIRKAVEKLVPGIKTRTEYGLLVVYGWADKPIDITGRTRK